MHAPHDGELSRLAGDELDARLYRGVAHGSDLAAALRAILRIARDVVDIEAIGVLGLDVEGAVASAQLAVGSTVTSSTYRLELEPDERRAIAARAHASFVGVASGCDGSPFDALLPRALPRPVVCAALGGSRLEGLVAMLPRGPARRAHVELVERLRDPITAALAIERRLRAASGLDRASQIHAAEAAGTTARSSSPSSREGHDELAARRARRRPSASIAKVDRGARGGDHG